MPQTPALSHPRDSEESRGRRCTKAATSPRGQPAPRSPGSDEDAPGHAGRLWTGVAARGGRRRNSQPLNTGFGGARSTALFAPGSKVDHSVSPAPHPENPCRDPRCAAPPRHTPETQRWHGGARGSGFRLSIASLQPRPETPGAARISGERAPQLGASTSALPGVLYLPG